MLASVDSPQASVVFIGWIALKFTRLRSICDEKYFFQSANNAGLLQLNYYFLNLSRWIHFDSDCLCPCFDNSCDILSHMVGVE